MYAFVPSPSLFVFGFGGWGGGAVMSLVETPSWCMSSGKCFWTCYPDFSRNYHLGKWHATTLEGALLFVLVAIALVDVVRQ